MLKIKHMVGRGAQELEMVLGLGHRSNNVK